MNNQKDDIYPSIQSSCQSKDIMSRWMNSRSLFAYSPFIWILRIQNETREFIGKGYLFETNRDYSSRHLSQCHNIACCHQLSTEKYMWKLSRFLWKETISFLFKWLHCIRPRRRNSQTCWLFYLHQNTLFMRVKVSEFPFFKF